MKFSKLRFFVFIFIFGLVVEFLIFSKEVNSTIDLASQADGVIATEYVDPKNNSIQVCWGDVDLMQTSTNEDFVKSIMLEPHQTLIDFKTQKLVQKKIQEQYNLKKVGIEFTGWKNCAPNDKSALRIFAFEKLSQNEMTYLPGQCEVGQSYSIYNTKTNKTRIEKRPRNIPNFMFLKMFDEDPNRLQIFIRQALHEFGHAAGLHHEHYQSEASRDPNCSKLLKYDSNFNVPFVNLGKIHSFTKYDPSSIMNYCFITKEDEKAIQVVQDIKLSRGDVHTLRCTYLKDQLRNEKCVLREVTPPEYVRPYDDEY